jgi:hypothetical protein
MTDCTGCPMRGCCERRADRIIGRALRDRYNDDEIYEDSLKIKIVKEW